MYTGINLNETKKFVSPKDPDQQNPTVFHLGAIDSFVKAHIEDSTTDLVPDPTDPREARIRICYAKRNLLTVKFGVRKIENFFDPETKKPATIEAESVTIGGEEYLALPNKVIALLATGELIPELVKEIKKLDELSEAEEKN